MKHRISKTYQEQVKRLPWRASTIKASAAHVKWEKRRNENMPAWIEVLFFLNNSEIVGVLASQQMTLNHSVWWASLAMEELCCSSSALVPFFSPHFPSLLYIHGAFSTLFRPPLCITHTQAENLTHFLWMKRMGVMSSLCSDGTLLHASLPHKFALIDSRRSHMLTNRSF